MPQTIEKATDLHDRAGALISGPHNRLRGVVLLWGWVDYEKHGRSAKGHMRSLRDGGGDAKCQQE